MSQEKKKSFPCSDRVCSTCFYQPYCAANDWFGFDSTNKDCPNYEEGMKQLSFFSKEFKGE